MQLSGISEIFSAQVSKWDESLGFHIPEVVVQALGLKEGDEIEIRLANRQRQVTSTKLDREACLDQLRSFRGRLPADFTLDRDETNAR